MSAASLFWSFFKSRYISVEGCCKNFAHPLQNCIMVFLYNFQIFKGSKTHTHSQIHYIHLLPLLCMTLDRKHISCDSDTWHFTFWMAYCEEDCIHFSVHTLKNVTPCVAHIKLAHNWLQYSDVPTLYSTEFKPNGTGTSVWAVKTVFTVTILIPVYGLS